MANRFNKCSNPATPSSNTTGYVGTFTGSFVDGTNVPRNRGLQYAANVAAAGPIYQAGASITGQQWTVSAYMRRISGAAAHSVSLRWLNSTGGVISTVTGPAITLPVATTGQQNVPRVLASGTAPANATGVQIVFPTVTNSSTQLACVTYENTSGVANTTAGQTTNDTNFPYFDGDGNNTNPATNTNNMYSWDGTVGLSTSKFIDVPPVTTKTGTDTFSLVDSSSVSMTDTSDDTFTFTDTASLLAPHTVSDTFTLTESVSIEQFAVPKSATDTFTLTETAVVQQTFYYNATDDATQIDSATVAASMLVTETHSLEDTSSISASVPSTDIATQTESASINVLATDSATTTEQQVHIAQEINDQATLSEQARIDLNVTDSATLSETVITGHYAQDSATLSEKVVINVITSDSATQTESASLFVRVVSDDTGSLYDEIKKLRTEPYRTEEPFLSREPAYTRRRAPFRVLAQDIFTKRFIHTDVPILGDPTLTYTLSGPNMFQGILQHEAPSMQNLEFPLEPYRTWLHVEEDEVIRMSTLLQPFVDDNKSRTRVMEGEGFSWYPKELVWQGEAYEGVQVDPASMIRKIWDHIQSYWSNIGVVVSATSTPVRIGVAKKNVEFENAEGENVSFQAGPYDLNWWEVTNLGSEIDKLCKETPIEFIENSFWNADRTDVKHRLELGYPRVGTRREDIYFQEGMNLTEIIPKRNENKDVWKSDIIVIGAGEGAKAIRGYASENTGRLRRAEVMENQDITDVKRAQAIADFEKQRRRRARYDIDAITINANHSNAPWGSFAQGDDILVEGTVIYDGRIADWNRITSYSYKPKSKRAVLSLSPSESFTYGAIPEVT